MRKLTYTKAHHLAKLNDELIAAFPNWIKTNPNGSREALFSLSGDGSTVVLWMPDTQDEAAVAAIITTHSPTPAPTPFDRNKVLKEKIDAAVADGLMPQKIKDVLTEWRTKL